VVSSKPAKLIEHLEFAITCDPDDRVINDAAVLIEGDRITDLGTSDEVNERLRLRSQPPETDRMSGRRLGLAPGFVDSHVHLSETLSRAVFPDVIDTRTWVFHWAKPFYAHVSPNDEAVGSLLGTAEMLRGGTTCFLDMGAQNDPAPVAAAVEQTGIRGVTGRHAADVKPREIPPGWSKKMVNHHFFPNADIALEALAETVQTWDGAAEGRLGVWVNIEGKEPCSLELHVGARELASEMGVGTTYHLATSLPEAHISQQRYGIWPIARVAQAGGLGDNLVLAHAVAVSPEEVDLLSAYGTKVAFCPSTSLKLAKGAAAIGKYPEMMEAGVTVGLGTDGVSASGNLNLHRQIHLVAGLFKDARMDANLVGARQALRMATIGGAKALGMETEIGSLEVGKKADLVLWDLNHPEWIPYGDPVSALVWSASTASVHQTWVGGQPCYRDGRVLGVDEKSLHVEARGRAKDIRARAGLGRTNIPLTTVLYQ
jgi:cytosine/adenosine deaminase-related metal-dependent hydrolase